MTPTIHPKAQSSNNIGGYGSKRAGVKVPAEVATSVVGDLVDAVADVSAQSTFDELLTAPVDMRATVAYTIVVRNRFRGSGADLVEIFENALVCQNRPIGREANRHTTQFMRDHNRPYSNLLLDHSKVLAGWYGLTISNSGLTDDIGSTGGRCRNADDSGHCGRHKRRPMIRASACSGSVRIGDATMQNDNPQGHNDSDSRIVRRKQDDQPGQPELWLDRDGSAGSWIETELVVEVER